MFNEILNYILGLGAAIFLPIIMIILGLCVKMKLKKAIMAGLTLGIAFTGMNVVLGFMFSSISPAAQALVERTGLELTAIDVGWSRLGTDFEQTRCHSSVWSCAYFHAGYEFRVRYIPSVKDRCPIYL